MWIEMQQSEESEAEFALCFENQSASLAGCSRKIRVQVKKKSFCIHRTGLLVFIWTDSKAP